MHNLLFVPLLSHTTHVLTHLETHNRWRSATKNKTLLILYLNCLYLYVLIYLVHNQIMYRKNARAITQNVLAVQQLNQFVFSGQLVCECCPLTFTWLRIFPRMISIQHIHGEFCVVCSVAPRKSMQFHNEDKPFNWVDFYL